MPASSTPILDLRSDPPPLPAQRKWQDRATLLPLAACFLVGFPVGGGWYVAALLAAAIASEFGGALVASASGIPVLAVPSLSGRMKLWLFSTLQGRSSLRQIANPSPRRLFYALTGGIDALMVLTALSSLAAIWISHPFVVALPVASVFFILAHITPQDSRPTVGTLLFLALRYPARATSCLASTVILGEECAGVRPRDFSLPFMQMALTAGPADPEYAGASVLAFYHHLDLGDAVTALQYLESALATPGSATVQRHLLWFEAAWASAALQKNPSQAKVWLERARALGELKWEASVVAEIAWCEGRFGKAATLFASSRSQMLREPLTTGVGLQAMDWFAAAEQECRAAINA